MGRRRRGRRRGRDLRARRPSHGCSRSGRQPASSLPPEQHLLSGVAGRHRQRRRGARAAAAPRGRDREAPVDESAISRKARSGARGRARGAGVAATRRRRPGSASRSRGACRTSGATSRPSGSGSSRLRRPGSAVGPALLDAIRFPSDPEDTELEQNDVAVLLRSDSLDAIAAAREGAVRRPRRPRRRHPRASRRRVRRRRACREARRRRGRSRRRPDPDRGRALPRLHLDAQRQSLGPSRIANLETLGLGRGSRRGTSPTAPHMHLSHIHENLEAWYVNSSHDDRVHTTFRPGLEVPEGTLTVPQGRAEVSTAADVRRSYRCTARSATAARSRLRLASSAVGRPRRHRLPGGHRDPAAGRLQHARQPVRLERRRQRLGRSGGRRPLRRLQPDERRLPPRAQRDGRRAAGRDDARRSSRAPRGRASTASSARPGGRTSSSRRAPIARSRSPSCSPELHGGRLRSWPGRSGGTGRRTGLKIRRLKGRGGSIPPFGIACTRHTCTLNGIRAVEPISGRCGLASIAYRPSTDGSTDVSPTEPSLGRSSTRCTRPPCSLPTATRCRSSSA